MARETHQEIPGRIEYPAAAGVPMLLLGDAPCTSETQPAALRPFAPSIMDDDTVDLQVAADVSPSVVDEPRTAANGARLAPPRDAVFDEVMFRQYVGDDNAVILRVLQSFLANTPGRLVAIGAALRSGDVSQVAGIAHSLKGSMSFLAAAAAVDAALEVETMAKTGDLQRIADAGAALGTEAMRLMNALQPLMAATLRRTQP